jgi:hypothetical protein
MTQQEPPPPNVAALFALLMEELCRAVLARGSWCGIPGPVAFITSLLLRRWAKRIAAQFAAIDAAALSRAADEAAQAPAPAPSGEVGSENSDPPSEKRPARVGSGRRRTPMMAAVSSDPPRDNHPARPRRHVPGRRSRVSSRTMCRRAGVRRPVGGRETVSNSCDFGEAPPHVYFVTIS